MVFVSRALCICALTVWASSSFGQNQYNYLSQESVFGLIQNVHLEIDDQATGSCWTNSTSIKSKVRLLLEQNSVSVSSEPFAFYGVSSVLLEISVLGYRDPGGICIVHSELEASTNLPVSVGGFDQRDVYSASYSAAIFRRAAIFSSQSATNQQIADFFEGASAEFVADIISARNNAEIIRFREVYPNYGKEVMTQNEWRAFLESQRSSQ